VAKYLLDVAGDLPERLTNAPRIALVTARKPPPQA
jgi:hypothetical protein